MLKVSKLLDYGLLVVVTMARNESVALSASKVADATGLNIPTVRKLLNQLSVKGVVTSKRGIDGGYMLVHNPGEITVLDIVEAVESSVNLTVCCDDRKKCNLANCTVSGYWRVLNSQFLGLLSATSINDIVNGNNKS